MESDAEMEHCSTTLSDENESDSDVIVDVEYECTVEENKEEEEKKNEEKCAESENLRKSADILCDTEDEPWEIEDDSDDSDDCQMDINQYITMSKIYNKQLENKEEFVRKKSEANKKSEKLKHIVLREEDTNNIETEEISNTSTVEKNNGEKSDEHINKNKSNFSANVSGKLIDFELNKKAKKSKKNVNLDEKSSSSSIPTNQNILNNSDEIKSKTDILNENQNTSYDENIESDINSEILEELLFNKDTDYDFDDDIGDIDSNKTNKKASSSSRFPGLPDSFDFPYSSDIFSLTKNNKMFSKNDPLKHTAKKIGLSLEEKETVNSELIGSMNNQTPIGNSFKLLLEPERNFEEEEDDNINVESLEDCCYIKDLSENLRLENNDEDSQTVNSECFEEDPDIVNPDIIYNIDLHQHFLKMDLLVEKIEETPYDPNLLYECITLNPIPQIKHELIKFTEEERKNFSEGISEWEYDIDHSDWNKIMVKRAAVFSAHAGFDIASEESLYVLADVAIDYIRQVATVMKDNFEIESRNPDSRSIDPINMALRELGVEGSVKELIRHFENDVFGRRQELLGACEYYQSVINQYIERLCPDMRNKNQNSGNENFPQAHSTNYGTVNKNNTPTVLTGMTGMKNTAGNVLNETIMTSTDVTSENILSFDENKTGSTSSLTEENSTVNTKIKNQGSSKSSAVDVIDMKTKHRKDRINKKLEFLKPLIPKVAYSEDIKCKSEERHLFTLEAPKEQQNFCFVNNSVPDRKERLKAFGFHCDSESSNHNKDEIWYDPSPVKKLIRQGFTSSPSIVLNEDIYHGSEKNIDGDIQLFESTSANTNTLSVSTGTFGSSTENFANNYGLFENVPAANEEWQKNNTAYQENQMCEVQSTNDNFIPAVQNICINENVSIEEACGSSSNIPSTSFVNESNCNSSDLRDKNQETTIQSHFSTDNFFNSYDTFKKS